jgi:hypothetical protein
MIYICTYAVICLFVGAASNRLPRWKTLVIAVAMITFWIMVCTWPFLDWKGGRYLETLSSGVINYFLYSVVLFVVPFLCGRYLIRMILWARRSRNLV